MTTQSARPGEKPPLIIQAEIPIPAEFYSAIEVLSGRIDHLSRQLDGLTKAQPASNLLPVPGESRFSEFCDRLGVKRSKWHDLVKAGRAPQPKRRAVNCVYYDNHEINRWLTDRDNYRVALAADLRSSR